MEKFIQEKTRDNLKKKRTTNIEKGILKYKE